MSFVDEVGVRHYKLVYFGPALAGKTTNFQYLYSRLPPDRRSRLVSYETEVHRTLVFDFEPLISSALPSPVRFHLYCCPGAVFYEAPRVALLEGVDGVVFVGSAQPARVVPVLERLDVLDRLLHDKSLALDHAPLVVQYNKMDLPDALDPGVMQALYNPLERPDFEAIATIGQGVVPTVKAAMKAVLVGARDEWKTRSPSPLEPDRFSRRAVHLLERDPAFAARLPEETLPALRRSVGRAGGGDHLPAGGR